ncbi:MAG: DUF4173 domain-containing protein [Pyrinomonadaceae bacterium]
MNSKTRIGLEILEAALLLGLLGDVLLRATPWGLNVLLWVGGLVSVMITLTLRRKREIWTKQTIALHGALMFFAAGFVWRDSFALQTLDVLAMLVLLAILSLPALKISPQIAGFLHYALGAVSSGFNAAFAPFLLIFGDIEWKTIPRSGWTKHGLAIIRGLAIAAPILLVFGVLFMAADAVFEGIVKNTFNIQPEILFSHVLLFSFFAWICAGYLRGALFGGVLNDNWTTDFSANKSAVLETHQSAASITDNLTEKEIKELPRTEAKPKEEKKDFIDYLPDFVRLGAIETGVVLGLINLLFLGFVIVQLRYFFGGMDFVQTTENFKLAEYARRGFFELCWVAALVLPILLTTHFLLHKNNLLTEKLFRTLSAVNIGLLFIIMYSAVNRMLLYTGNLGYGMTTMRLYPTAFMFWLALVFVWFGLTVLRGQAKHFAWGALWMALFVVAGLHVLNPDNFIVRHNVILMEQGRSFDVVYNARYLSDDAIPVLADALPQMTFEQQCVVKDEFWHRWENKQDRDFRTWNLSRWQSRNILTQLNGSFDNSACPPQSQRNNDDF